MVQCKDERSTHLERPLDNVNQNINVFTFTPDEKPSLVKGHISDEKWVESLKRGSTVYRRM